MTVRKTKDIGDVVVEHFRPGQPSKGKVLAAVQAHADDVPLLCAGTIAKMAREGYTPYLIQTTNDEKCGPTSSIGRTVLSNEEEVAELSKVLHFRQSFNLGYRNHRMDEVSPVELRARLIFLFRLLKVDTVLTFNPWGHGEENPDHYITATAVQAACWMAGMDKDYPEHLAAGVDPHEVTKKYYWVARLGQPYNRIVDISSTIDVKIDAMITNRSQGPAGQKGRQLRKKLAEDGLCLPELGEDDETADRNYVKLFLLDADRNLGKAYGCDFAEAFYHVATEPPPDVDRYLREHMQRLPH